MSDHAASTTRTRPTHDLHTYWENPFRSACSCGWTKTYQPTDFIGSSGAVDFSKLDQAVIDDHNRRCQVMSGDERCMGDGYPFGNDGTFVFICEQHLRAADAWQD